MDRLPGRVLALVLLVAVTGCMAPSATEDGSPRWTSGSDGGSMTVSVLGDGEAQFDGNLGAVGAKDVVVEAYVARTCPDDGRTPEVLGSHAQALGDVEGERAYSMRVTFKQGPWIVEGTPVAYTITRASNLPPLGPMMCFDMR